MADAIHNLGVEDDAGARTTVVELNEFGAEFLLGLSFGSRKPGTLVSNVLTWSDTIWTVVSAESGVVDDLDAIIGIERKDGQVVMLVAAPGHTITVKHNVATPGGMELRAADDIPISGDHMLGLIYDQDADRWRDFTVPTTASAIFNNLFVNSGLGIGVVNTVAGTLVASSTGGVSKYQGGSSGVGLELQGNAGTLRELRFNDQTTGNRRWIVRGNNAAESGGNAGTSFQVSRYADDNTFLGTPIEILRATGRILLDAISTGSAITIGGDVRMFRGAPNRLDLQSGDNFNLVNGAYQIGAVAVIDALRNIIGVAGTFSGEVKIGGDLNHDGSKVGFYGATPVVQSPAYAVANVTTDRSYDADSTSQNEIADVLGTLIADLKASGLIG